MDWKDIKGFIGKGAPLIGSLMGGPAGGMVGSMVANALGVEANPQSIADELKSNPDAMLKLKELQLTHKTKFEELNLEETKAHLADRQNARQREIENLKAGGSNDFMYWLAGLVVVGFFAAIGVVFFVDMPKESEKLIYLLLGILGAEFGSVMRYFFGSSKGSADKTAMLVGNKK